jgi:hypothetical protein
MMDVRSQRLSGNRKRNTVPLSSLRTSEVVRTVVEHPRRLGELISLLEDKDRAVRGRAAATVARLSETHAGRLVRIIDRLKEDLSDDSAYVRWSLVYALGHIAGNFPGRIQQVLLELTARMDDENRVVRIIASRAVQRLAASRPKLVKGLFESHKREIPELLARSIKRAESRAREARKGR